MSNKPASKQIFAIQMALLNLRHDKDVPPSIMFALGEIHAQLEAAKDAAKVQEDSSAMLLKLHMAQHADDVANAINSMTKVITPKTDTKEGT